jgi:23S rRNA U2552 (ribose-2'-O)-methylase RlmE/FtsJ
MQNSSGSRSRVEEVSKCRDIISSGAKLSCSVESNEEHLSWKDGSVVIQLTSQEWAWMVTTHVASGGAILVPPHVPSPDEMMRVVRQGVVPIRAARDWIDVRRDISTLWTGETFTEGQLHPRPFGHELLLTTILQVRAKNKDLFSIGSEIETVTMAHRFEVNGVHYGTVESLEKLAVPASFRKPEARDLVWALDVDEHFSKYATPRGESHRMANVVWNLTGYKSFTDAFAGYGSDSISLSFHGFGTAYEIDKGRHAHAVENLRSRPVNVVNHSVLDILEQIETDVLYLDPPYDLTGLPSTFAAKWVVVKRAPWMECLAIKSHLYVVNIEGVVRFDIYMRSGFAEAFEDERVAEIQSVYRTQNGPDLELRPPTQGEWKIYLPFTGRVLAVRDSLRQRTRTTHFVLNPWYKVFWFRTMLEACVRPLRSDYDWSDRIPIALFSISNSNNPRQVGLIKRIAMADGVVAVPFGTGMRTEQSFEDWEFMPADFNYEVNCYTALDFVMMNRRRLPRGTSVSAGDLRGRTWMVITKRARERWQYTDSSQTHYTKYASNLLRAVFSLDPFSLYEARAGTVARFGGVPTSGKVSGFLVDRMSGDDLESLALNLQYKLFSSPELTATYRRKIERHRGRFAPVAYSKARQLDSQIAISPRSALFLAEAPGMFSKFFTEKYKIEDWRAVSLDDGGDGFGLIMLTREHWSFEDASTYSDGRKYDLVTVDLGFPTAHENQAFDHYLAHRETLDVAIKHCAPGGTVIAKLYGGLEDQFSAKFITASDIRFVKPEASNIFNREVYMILLNPTGLVRRGRRMKSFIEHDLYAIQTRFMNAYGSVLSLDSWVPMEHRFYVDVSGHLVNFLLCQEMVIFDIARYMDNVEGNARPGKRTPPRPIDESGSGGLWHSACEWYLATYTAERLAKQFGITMRATSVAYVRARLVDIFMRFPSFGRRSKSVTELYPNSKEELSLRHLLHDS